ncbi:sensor histidine kinase [Luteimonas lutimaris]|uniref:histidine kinase n=1 Tax=Luteimonas lutimaris TaxID=698645 RepID=A0ABP7M875_9GAMM|nr:HAMP domain-containing sensor histidine kinase [Luteimonas sp.]
MSQGLPRKLRYAFILQVMLASVAVVVGAAVTGSIVKRALTDQQLRNEAEQFWSARAGDPAHPLPRTSTVHGWFVATGHSQDAVPAELRGFGNGISRLADGDRKLFIDERPQGRLYLVMSFELLDRVIRRAGVVSILLALLAIYLTTWLTYRATKRLVTPVSWLARQVARWDPSNPDMQTIAPGRMPGEDGSEVRQLTGALRRLTRRTRELVARERDFTRDASHELRTPLTVIRVATDMMLADPEIPQRTHRTLKRVQGAGRDMEAIIDAFLILARENVHAPLTEDFNVVPVVEEEVAKARPQVEGKPVELELAITASPRVHASPRVLAVMLGQLLENACAFTESGRIEVRLEAGRVVVSDTGIGMPAEVLHKAWDPFYRADLVNPSGKGMGLSIVRRLGERFHWPVRLDSTPGAGTTASIEFARDVIARGDS